MRSWRGWSWDDGNFGGSGLEPQLLARPDADSEDVQRAVAVIDEYLAPHGSPEAVAAGKPVEPFLPFFGVTLLLLP